MANLTCMRTQARESSQESSTYNYILQSPSTLAVDCCYRPKLKRQATAFQHLVLQHALANEHSITNLLTPWIGSQSGPL